MPITIATIYWRPVSDGLPEVHEAVLVAFREMNVGASVCGGYVDKFGHWMSEENLPLDVVTHWAPMPEPPTA